MRVGGTQTDPWKDRDRKKGTVYQLHSLNGGKKWFGSADRKRHKAGIVAVAVSHLSVPPVGPEDSGNVYKIENSDSFTIY